MRATADALRRPRAVLAPSHRRSRAYRMTPGHQARGWDMLYTVSGAALTIFGCGSFWYLLPRNGKVHPFVANSDVGSMITIGIMTVLTAGIGLLCAGLLS